MIITVTLNPAVDKTLFVPAFAVNEVNRVAQIRLDPGGKGINVSKAVRVFGADTICLGLTGGETGAYIQRTLDEIGLRNDMVCGQQSTRTNIKVVDLQLGTNTDINEAGSPADVQTLQAVWDKILLYAKKGDTVVIAGKNPPQTPEDLLAQWTRKLLDAGVTVCLDTVGEPMRRALEEGPTVIKPNLEELSELAGVRLQTPQQVAAAAGKILEKGTKLVAVSMGGDGAVFVTKEQTVRVRVPAVRVVSTVGAGDTMMAAIAYCMEEKRSLTETARFAAAAATAAVQIDGSEPAPMEMIQQLYERVTTE